MKKSLIIDVAHLLLKKEIEKNDIILDMTMGNGKDTLLVSTLSDHVYAFDIQEKALDETKKILSFNQITHAHLIHDDHFYFDKYISHFKGAIFNLGYLPKGDKQITTNEENTIRTFDKLLSLMDPNGFIMFVVYTGHEEGKKESKALLERLSQLDQNIFKVLRVDLPFVKNNPPYILMVYKNEK